MKSIKCKNKKKKEEKNENKGNNNNRTTLKSQIYLCLSNFQMKIA